MYAFVMTGMTGKRATEGRTSTVAGVDVNTRTMTVALLSLPAAMLVLLLLWPLLGNLAVLTVPIVIGLAIYLFVSRTNDALEVHQYRARADKVAGRRDIGKFFVAGRQVDPTMSESVTVWTNSAPVTTGHASTASQDGADLWAS